MSFSYFKKGGCNENANGQYGFQPPRFAACNTMQGFGKDIKSGGQAIENQAK